MIDRRIDNVLDMILELDYVARIKNIKHYDAIRNFNANCYIYDYAQNRIKKSCSRWDFAIVQTNLTLEAKIEYQK